MNGNRFIACGMYAPSPDVKNAWQDLFDRFYPLADLDSAFQHALVFEDNESVLRDPDLLIGHTCGYPLMGRLQDDLMPFCVPCFDVPGTSGKQYSSRFIVPANSGIESLQQCRGKTVAINNADSNSGMNLLRHALATRGARGQYFSEVIFTGGHLASLDAVAANRAQLAAIDCVSYQLAVDIYPDLASALRVIGHSVTTCGLPLVVPISQYSPLRCESYVAALNLALEQAPASVRETLHLTGFESVGLDDYESILELEKFAIECGYPELK